MIIAFVQTKGGTGKSTLALCTAYAKKIRQEFSSIALIEMDPQGTLSKWWMRRESNPNKQISSVHFNHISDTDKNIILNKLETIERDNELLILDVPGESVGKFHTQFACAIADLVLIPMRTSTNDEEAFEDNLLPIIEKILKVDNDSKSIFHVIPSFTHPLASRESIYRYFNEIMPEYVSCFKGTFTFRSVFENFSRAGNTLFEYADMVKANRKMLEKADRAIEDIETIVEKILELRF